MKKCVFLHIQHNTELEILQKLGPEISVQVYPEKQVLVATAIALWVFDYIMFSFLILLKRTFTD